MESSILEIMNPSSGPTTRVTTPLGEIVFMTAAYPGSLQAKTPTIFFVTRDSHRPVYILEHSAVKNLDAVPREALIEGLWQVKRQTRAAQVRAHENARSIRPPAAGPPLTQLIPSR